MPANVTMLTRYNAWANKLIFVEVAKLPPAEAVKMHPNSFGSIVGLLNHNYVVDLIWQAHLQGREHGFTDRNPKDYPALEELWQLQQEIDKWYINYYDGLSVDALNMPVNFKFIGGTQGVMTHLEILFHIVNHTTYHRGFIADMFYKIPAKPPTTDLPVFLQSISLARTCIDGKQQ